MIQNKEMIRMIDEAETDDYADKPKQKTYREEKEITIELLNGELELIDLICCINPDYGHLKRILYNEIRKCENIYPFLENEMIQDINNVTKKII